MNDTEVFMGFVLYFIPSLVAFMRGHRRRWQVLIANFFLGWTVFIWVIALVIAVGPDTIRAAGAVRRS